MGCSGKEKKTWALVMKNPQQASHQELVARLPADRREIESLAQRARVEETSSPVTGDPTSAPAPEVALLPPGRLLPHKGLHPAWMEESFAIDRIRA